VTSIYTPDETCAIAHRHNANPCGKTAQTQKYGRPYTLVCQLQAPHRGLLCRDLDNDRAFEPDHR
jgi:hypothetical protein